MSAMRWTVGRATLALVISCALLAPRSLACQAGNGDRARATLAADGREIEGIIERHTPDSLFLVSPSGGERTSLAYSNVRELRLYRGRRGAFGAGFAAGLAVGVVVLTKEGAFGCDNGCVVVAIPFAAATGLAGGIIGGLMRHEVWQRVRMPLSP